MRKMRRFALVAVLVLTLAPIGCWLYAPSQDYMYPPGLHGVFKRFSTGAHLFQLDCSAAYWMMQHERAQGHPCTIHQFKIVNAYGSQRITDERTIGVRHDGSTAIRNSQFTDLTFVSDRRIVHVDHKDYIVAGSPLPWSVAVDLAYRPTTAPCLGHGSLSLPKNARLISWSTILGFSVMNYQWDSDIGRHTLSLAPALNCATLKEVLDAYGEPPSNTWETKSVDFGEPEANLFSVPQNYRLFLLL